MSTLERGDLAPEFSIPDETGKLHSLADQRGRWTILYFYPEDDTPGCTTEACQFRDLTPKHKDTGADVWGVSPDDASSHRRFPGKYDLPVTLPSGVEHAGGEVYRGRREETNYRPAHIGIVRSAHPIDSPGP